MLRRIYPAAAFVLSACVLASGCGGASSSSKGTQLERTLVKLESSAQRDRRKMRDLENELVVLRDKLRSARRASVAVPRLPVEIREPEPVEAEPESDYEVVGVDEDGVEIVYIGDAAQDRSVRPRRLPDTRGPNPTAAPPARRPSPPSYDVPMVDERLPVTDKVGPTVARQLREAPAPGQRRPVPEAMPVVPERALDRAPERSEPAKTRPKHAASAEPAAPDADDARAQYKRYYEALRAGNHAYAITGFGNFVERFPDHEFADNARYWLAEAFYDQRNYRRALDEFRNVVTDYPRGNKVPDALLKIGYCHLALGNAAEARAALRRVINEFPRSQPAKLAMQRLESVDKD